MVRLRLRYSGTVQGVGFRATARLVAGGHAVTGWVQNQVDGSVLLEVQGERLAVEQYLEELDQHVAGLVRDRSEDPVPIVEGDRAFDVRR